MGTIGKTIPRQVAQAGQGLVEYALILALIAVLAISATLFLGAKINTVLSNVGNSVAGHVSTQTTTTGTTTTGTTTPAPPPPDGQHQVGHSCGGWHYNDTWHWWTNWDSQHNHWDCRMSRATSVLDPA